MGTTKPTLLITWPFRGKVGWPLDWKACQGFHNSLWENGFWWFVKICKSSVRCLLVSEILNVKERKFVNQEIWWSLDLALQILYRFPRAFRNALERTLVHIGAGQGT